MAQTRGRPKGRSNKNRSAAPRSFGPLGDLLRSKRLGLGLGLADVADACHCSVQFVSNIEHGRAPLPWEKLDLVAKVLQIPTEDLQAANLTIRSDFQGFLSVTRGAKLTGTVKGQLLGGMRGAASAVTLAARDRQLQEVLERYQSASADMRKRFVKSALELFEATAQ